MASFDDLASVYEPLERLCFAGALQKLRCFCLPHLDGCARGLLIGDGDGRFSTELLQQNRSIQVDSLDISPRMLEHAKGRAGENAARLHQHIADALSFSYPENEYDFIGLHFSLDCFSQEEIDGLLPQLERALVPGGTIAYSDFQANTRRQRLLIGTLYLCFRVAAGLKTKQLPVVRWSANFKVIASTEILGGLAFSAVLKKG